jgi:hypothetical protein
MELTELLVESNTAVPVETDVRIMDFEPWASVLQVTKTRVDDTADRLAAAEKCDADVYEHF